MKSGFEELSKDPTDEQKASYREAKKKDCKAQFILHQCVDAANFKKISMDSTAKKAWEILDKAYAMADKLKNMRLQTQRRHYELLQMENSEGVANYFTRVQSLINLMKDCGEKFTDQVIVEKILRNVSPRFDQLLRP